MKAFWRESELNESEESLFQAVVSAHSQSTYRDNISTIVLRAAAEGSGDYVKSVIAALSTLGSIHAPLIDSWRVLNMPMESISEAIKSGVRLPGWGTSFQKVGIDPIWAPVSDLLARNHATVFEKIEAITNLLHESKKEIYPNPSCFSAAAGIVLQIPPAILPWLFIHSRLADWSILFMQQLTKET